MSQPKNNLDTLQRQVSAPKGTQPGGSQASSVPRGKFKPARTVISGSQPGPSSTQIKAPAHKDISSVHNSPKQSSTVRRQAAPSTQLSSAKASSNTQPASYTQPRFIMHTHDAIDISPSGSESSAYALSAGRKRRSEEPESPVDFKRKKYMASEQDALQSVIPTANKGKERAVFYSFVPLPHITSGGSSSTTPYNSTPPTATTALAPISISMQQDDLQTKSMAELMDLLSANIDSAAKYKKDKMAIEYGTSQAPQDPALIDVMIDLIEARTNAIKQAMENQRQGLTSHDVVPSIPASRVLTDVSTDIPEDQSMLDDLEEPIGPPMHVDDSQDDVQIVTDVPYREDLPRPNRSDSAGQHSSNVQALTSPSPPIYEVSDDEYWGGEDDTGFPDVEDGGQPDLEEVYSLAPNVGRHEGADGNPPAVQNSSDLVGRPNYPEVMEVLRTRFNLASFRRHQLEAILATLEGRDVVVLMPTGGGKSLCYQLPALCTGGTTKGVTIVVTPLLALMIDQVASLRFRGIRAEMLNGEMSDTDRTKAVDLLRGPASSKPSLFYITPERLAVGSMINYFKELQRTRQLARFVIDEAHLIYTWGRDFRCSFNQLSMIRETFPHIPIIAVTATAPPVILHDIIDTLKLRANCVKLQQSYNRPNLHYFIYPKPRDTVTAIVQFINEHHRKEPGIVYCIARDKCERVAESLSNAGVKAKHFHAEMTPQEKKQHLHEWMIDECQVIVATIAFGMGIDKPNVRFVIHHDAPASLTGYIQETGRAGRDGKRSDCVLYNRSGDTQFHLDRVRKNTEISPEERQRQLDDVRELIEYVQNDVDCRRTQLLHRFNEPFDFKLCAGTCDNCASSLSGAIEQDMTEAAVNLVLLVQAGECRGRDFKVSRGALVAAFLGRQSRDVLDKNLHTLKQYGLGKGIAVKLAERLFDRLLSLDIFKSFVWKPSPQSHPVTSFKLGHRAAEWLASPEKIILKTLPPKPRAAAKEKTAGQSSKRKMARRELSTDPIQDASLPTALWGDDDAPIPTLSTSAAGPSRAGQAVASASNATSRGQAAASRATASGSKTNDSDDPHKKCLDKLMEVRAQLTEDVLNPEDVASDECLQLLSVMLPSDGVYLKSILQDAMSDKDADHVYRQYGRAFLDVCTKFSMRPPASLIANDLHERYDYRQKPTSRGG